MGRAIALDKNGKRGPLIGVPFGIKDIIDTNNMSRRLPRWVIWCGTPVKTGRGILGMNHPDKWVRPNLVDTVFSPSGDERARAVQFVYSS